MTRSAKFPVLTGLAVVAGLAWSAEAVAGKASVVDAMATDNGNDSYSFTASVAHADTGWKHYADKFEILAPGGKVLGTRVLYHPHVDEQPFTRGLGGVTIPPGLTHVIVRAWDNVHKAGEETFSVKLPGR
ncbi:MAG: hypothetical protein JKY68_03965 [Rhodospirillales bacterium]|nr:hypothetical protein [Rhodospirillales bacterium]